MRSLNGGYVMIDLVDPKTAYKNATISAKDGDKPVMVYGANGLPYFAELVDIVDTVAVIKGNNKVITITSAGVVTSDITNITELSDAQCEALECGDIVVKKTGDQLHSYRVSYKEDKKGLCLTYVDASVAETVSYDYTGGHWVYNSTDTFPFES